MSEHATPPPPGDLRPLVVAGAHPADRPGLDAYTSRFTDPTAHPPGPGPHSPLTDPPNHLPLQAVADAGRDVALHAAIAALAASGGVGAGFLVDPDKADAALRSLKDAQQILLDALLGFVQRARYSPPGEDHVSRRIAENANQMASNAYDYVRVLTDQVEAVKDALQAQIDAYRAADRPDPFRRV